MVGVYEYDPLPDTILLCKGQHIRLGHSFLDATYSWNTGSTDSTITIDSPGRYIVNATIDGCQLSDTVIVIDPSALISDMPHDTLSCLPLSLSIPVPGSYTWSDSSHADSITISDAGEYGLTITNTCGVYKTNFSVTGRPCECHVFVPNAFTPNGDGTNDIFQPGIACDFPIRNIRCIIADRWGEIVYCSLDEDIYNIKWDGTYKDKQQEPGIYILLFEYAYLENGTSHTTTVKGSITLIR
jgi:gliding motility-associated-like protein